MCLIERGREEPGIQRVNALLRVDVDIEAVDFQHARTAQNAVVGRRRIGLGVGNANVAWGSSREYGPLDAIARDHAALYQSGILQRVLGVVVLVLVGS